jgi:predicted GH43/DUF377 family glycosyl hydrolase
MRVAASTEVSSVTQRVRPMVHAEFQTVFTYSEAMPYEEGITRRDPSPVINVGGTYYVWYSRSVVDASGYHASIWVAASRDGRRWHEQGEAIPKGGAEAWDENGVFTPTTLIAGGTYYLFYTAVPAPFDNDDGGPGGTPTAIGVASAESPGGPWVRFDGNPVLCPGEPGTWDSHRVDDACLIVRGAQFWMYYKGRQKGLSPAETKMGLAIADYPTGPYRKHAANPVLDSGHEICVWPHGNGTASIVAPVGPQGGTIQYAADGVHFVKQAEVVPPSAPGPYRVDAYADRPWGEGITWGLCQDVTTTPEWPCLLRFDCDLRARRQR